MSLLYVISRNIAILYFLYLFVLKNIYLRNSKFWFEKMSIKIDNDLDYSELKELLDNELEYPYLQCIYMNDVENVVIVGRYGKYATSIENGRLYIILPKFKFLDCYKNEYLSHEGSLKTEEAICILKYITKIINPESPITPQFT